MRNPRGADIFLAIDGGNSRLKTTLFRSGEEPLVRVYAPEDSEQLLCDLESDRVERAAMASVGHYDTRLTESLRYLLNDRFLQITPSTEVPIRIAYSDPAALGIDRKATSVAAAGIYPGESLLVIDAGSAMTCDLICDGFLGGSISPGLQMRLRALSEFTAGLPLVTLEDNISIPAFASDTMGAIAGGTFNGFINEVIGDIAAAALTLGHLDRVVLTGGDAPLIQSRLTAMGNSDCCMVLPENIEITYDPYLLAKGVRMIYNHHEHEL